MAAPALRRIVARIVHGKRRDSMFQSLLHRAKSSRRRWSSTLRVEALEERCVPSGAGASPALQDYGLLPLSFEANQGQADGQVNFLSRGSGYSLFLTPGKAVLDLQNQAVPADTLSMQVLGANLAV